MKRLLAVLVPLAAGAALAVMFGSPGTRVHWFGVGIWTGGALIATIVAIRIEETPVRRLTWAFALCMLAMGGASAARALSYSRNVVVVVYGVALSALIWFWVERRRVRRGPTE